MSKPKYKQGRKIETVADFEKSKCTYFKVHGKSTHRAWIESWQYRVLKMFIQSGAIYEADLIEGGKDVLHV